MELTTLASAQVPKEIQQALIQRIASKHWNSYSSPRAGYRAVYLHQVTSEQTLFGWFYNDEADDVGRIPVPYFICYYLAGPLLASQLEAIFTCLHKGPLALVDRQNPPDSLEALVISDLNYQPARPGVEIPPDIYRYSHIALKQEQLLDLFIPLDEPEMVTEPNEQTYEQQGTNFSSRTHYPAEGADWSLD